MPLKMEQTRSQSSGRVKAKEKNIDNKRYLNNKKSTSFIITNFDETKNNISNDSGVYSSNILSELNHLKEVSNNNFINELKLSPQQINRESSSTVATTIMESEEQKSD